MPCNFQCLTKIKSLCVWSTLMSFYVSIKMVGAADLQIADGWRVVYCYAGGVGHGQLDAISEPNHGSSWVSLHLTADVGWVPLPRVHCHCTQDLWSNCINRKGMKMVNIKLWKKGKCSIQGFSLCIKNGAKICQIFTNTILTFSSVRALNASVI